MITLELELKSTQHIGSLSYSKNITEKTGSETEKKGFLARVLAKMSVTLYLLTIVKVSLETTNTFSWQLLLSES